MRYVPDLLRWARRCGVPASDAPDVAQVVLLRAWRAWDRCAQPSDARAAWLFAIVAKVASEFARTPKLRVETRDPLDLTETPDETPLPDAPLEQREALVTLDDLRAGTTPERWRVFLAYEVEGVSIAALSKREAAPVGTLYTRLRLARRDVRAVVRRHRAKLMHDDASSAHKLEKEHR